jgi:hypothetical protein
MSVRSFTDENEARLTSLITQTDRGRESQQSTPSLLFPNLRSSSSNFVVVLVFRNFLPSSSPNFLLPFQISLQLIQPIHYTIHTEHTDTPHVPAPHREATHTHTEKELESSPKTSVPKDTLSSEELASHAPGKETGTREDGSRRRVVKHGARIAFKSIKRGQTRASAPKLKTEGHT